MVDKSLIPTYNQQQVASIVADAVQYALSVQNLGNGIQSRAGPTMEGDIDHMGRQKVHVILPTGEFVWITGSTSTELVLNALSKYGAPQQPVPARSETFKEYTDKIFELFLCQRWKPSTTETNRFLLDKHIMPFFATIPLTEIDTAKIQEFFQLKKHLSKSYTKQMLILLHEIFENAIEDKKMTEDPTRSKRITLPQKATKRDALDSDDFMDIVQHLDLLSTDEARLIALLCFTGMRRGEILGLKWECITDDSITVQAEVLFDGNTSVFNEYTKSASGVRVIPIPDELQPYLADRGEGLVFGGDKPYTQSKFARMWQRIGKKINLHGATPHVFRHTYLTMLAASDVDPKTIQALAGHADFSFTFNRYIDKDRRNIMNAGRQLSERVGELTKSLTHTKPLEPLKTNALKSFSTPAN